MPHSLKTHLRFAAIIFSVALSSVALSTLADPYADAVDASLTNINDESCTEGGLNGGCIGQPSFVLGAPDFVPGQGGTTASLGLNGTVGLVFVDEPCIVDDDVSVPDIIVYEQGGIQTEDFAVDAARSGQQLAGNPVNSIQPEGVNQPARMLDLTGVIGGAGQVDRIQIIDIDNAGDAGSELPGFEIAAGADIDAVECFPSRVALIKTDAIDPVNAGDVVSYTVTATNIGTLPLSDVVVRDTLPYELTFVSSSPASPICTHSGDAQGGIVACNLGGLAVGASVEIEVQALAGPTDVEILVSNTALVFTSQPDVIDSVAETTTIVPDIADLDISMFANTEPVFAGDEEIYTIQVGNAGPGNATGVVIEDTLPVGAVFESATSIEPGVNCTHVTGVVTCTLDVMPPGPGFLINITARLSVPGIATNEVNVTADQPDPGIFPNMASVETTVLVSGVTITDTINAPDDRLLDFGAVLLGDSVQGMLTIQNIGTDPVEIGQVPVLLNAPFLVTDPSTCFGVILQQQGDSCSLTIEFTPLSTGDFSDGFVLDLGSQMIPITVSGTGTIGNVDIVLKKFADNIELVAGDAENDRVTFTVTVRNDGPGTAGVIVTDQLTGQLKIPDGESPIASRGLYDPTTGEWPVGELAPGQSETLTIPAQVKANQVGKKPKCISNTATATITSNGIMDSNPSNNTQTVDLSLGGCADLEVPFVQQRFYEISGDTYVEWRVAAISNGPSFDLPFPWQLRIDLPTEGLSEDPVRVGYVFTQPNDPDPFIHLDTEACAERIIFVDGIKKRRLLCGIQLPGDPAYCETLYMANPPHPTGTFPLPFPSCSVIISGRVEGPFAGGFTVRNFTSGADDPVKNNDSCPRGNNILFCDIVPLIPPP